MMLRIKHCVGTAIGYAILGLIGLAFFGVVAGIYYITHVRFCW